MTKKVRHEVPRLPPHDLHDEENRLKKVGGYIIGKSIGEGSFAKVKEGIHIMTNMRVAVKVINKTELKDTDYMMRNLHREADVLRKIRHENIVQLYEVMETENHYYLVLELVRGGDLMTHICNKKRLSEQEARKYTRQIISAVNYLHSIGIVHRDLKVENLLLDEDKNVKIIDFGLSNSLGKNGLLGTQCGSPAYAAPEVFSKNLYGPSVDIWSIGINLYAMLTGQLPFHVEPINIAALHEKIMKGAKIPSHFSKECQDLLSKLLVAKEEDRIGMEDLMQHAWVNDNCGSLKPYTQNDELQIDSLALEAAVDMGVNREDILNSLRSRKPTKYAAIYFLLLEKLSVPRKSSLPKIKELRRGSVDVVNLQKASEKNRNMMSPTSKRRIKKAPKNRLSVAEENLNRSSSDKVNYNQEDSGASQTNNIQPPSYNIKQARRRSVGETIQNFIKDKLRSSDDNKKKSTENVQNPVEEIASKITGGEENQYTTKKDTSRKSSITDFLKSPLDMTRAKSNRRHSINTFVTPPSPELAEIGESSNFGIGMFSSRTKTKKVFPVPQVNGETMSSKITCNG